MANQLHLQFAEWLEAECKRLAEELQPLPKDHEHRGMRHPDLHIAASLDEEDLVGSPTLHHVDIAGNAVARFFEDGGQVIGLAGAAFTDAQKVIDKVWARRDFHDLVTRKAIEDVIFERLAAIHGAQAGPSVSEQLLAAAANARLRTVWIPIDEFVVLEELPFADAVLRPVSRAEIDELVAAMPSKLSDEELSMVIDKMRRELAGKTVMQFQLTAAADRAQEIALERADDYMALLQFFGAPLRVLALVSHAAPSGMRPYRSHRTLAHGASGVSFSEHIAEPTYKMEITPEYRGIMEECGLAVLSSLPRNAACDFEQSLLDSLLVYGRAAYQLDSADKLLQVMTAVEMFALRSDSEPIQAALADRIAFSIASKAERRQEAARTLRSAYTIRSGRTHHGRPLEEVETVERFLADAWTFFFNALRSVGRFKTRTDFLNHLDHLKYQ